MLLFASLNFKAEQPAVLFAGGKKTKQNLAGYLRELL